MTEIDWSRLEAWLREAFGERSRKSGGLLVEHSLRVGRRLRDRSEAHETVFAAYCHDVLEDLPVGRAALEAMALEILGCSERAGVAVHLVEQASYSAAEYALDKPARKAAAVERWLACEDRRVGVIKIADVEDNDADAERVSAAFAADYRSWALPLRDGLRRKWIGAKEED